MAHAIRALGRQVTDVRACVLTHAHFGTSVRRRAQKEWGVPIFAHRDEECLAAHPYRYAHENPRAIYAIMHPKAIPMLVGMVRAGALRVKGVSGLSYLAPVDRRAHCLARQAARSSTRSLSSALPIGRAVV